MSDFETKILFWNINRNQPGQHIAAIAQRDNMDIILLAESDYRFMPEALVSALNSAPRGRAASFRHIVDPNDGKVQIFSRIPQDKWKLLVHHSRYQIWRIRRSKRSDLYLAIGHFQELHYEQGDKQRKLAVDLRFDIQSLEKRVIGREAAAGHAGLPLIVIGDMNASPFDEGIAGVYALNATSRRAIAAEGAREMDGKFYPFMYNPMWQFLSASEDRPAGTYYKRLSKPICYYWYVLDQVLLRPALMAAVKDEDIRIVESAGPVSLIKPNGTPIEISDHLPIAVTVHI